MNTMDTVKTQHSRVLAMGITWERSCPLALLGTRVVMPGLEHIDLAFIAKISSGMGVVMGNR